MNLTDSVDKAMGRIPFLLAFLAPLFSGSLFIAVNVPLIFMLAEGRKFTSFLDLVENGLIQNWNIAIQTSNVLTVTVILFGSLVMGLLITSVERLASYVVAVSLELVLKRVSFFSKVSFFSSGRMTDASYNKVLSWFFEHPAQKAHWEWELFLYYLYWSITINLGISLLLSVFLLSGHITFSEIIEFIVALGLTLGFSLLHSSLMDKVHKMYLKQAIPEENHNQV